ncbi:TIM barrel protein [Candidatus Bathyarchaeota archaeon]|nr:TIM barrel protein [Candidatus Bathyarchaeota archaeon]
MDLAVDLGKPLVRPFPCADKPTYMSTEEALNIIIHGLKDLVEYAEARDIKIALDITHSQVTNTVNNAIKILERIDSNYFGFNIHTVGRLAILLTEALIANSWSDKIFHTHLLDTKRAQ